MNPLLFLIVAIETPPQSPGSVFLDVFIRIFIFCVIAYFIVFSVKLFRHGDEILDNLDTRGNDGEEDDADEDFPSKIVITFRIKEDDADSADTPADSGHDIPASIDLSLIHI